MPLKKRKVRKHHHHKNKQQESEGENQTEQTNSVPEKEEPEPAKPIEDSGKSAELDALPEPELIDEDEQETNQKSPERPKKTKRYPVIEEENVLPSPQTPPILPRTDPHSVLFPHPALIKRELNRRAGKNITPSPHKHFTPEEDEVIRQNYHGEKTRWKHIGELLGRTPKSCKDRWNNKLSPRIDNSDWTHDDLLLLDKLVKKYGPKYSRLAGFFPGRNGYQVKNHYLTFLRQKHLDPDEELTTLNSQLAKDVEFPPTTLKEIEAVKEQLIAQLKRQQKQ